MNAEERSYAEDEIRTIEQNKKFHAVIADVARQLQWAGDFMDPEDWKRIFLAAVWGQKTVPNPLDAQKPFIVVNNRRSRGLVISEMSDLITQIIVFGDERGVKWSVE